MLQEQVVGMLGTSAALSYGGTAEEPAPAGEPQLSMGTDFKSAWNTQAVWGLDSPVMSDYPATDRSNTLKEHHHKD